MTNRLFKIIFSLILVIILISTCFVVFIAVSVGAWLHTYQAFTSRELVAQVILSEIKSDEQGEYIEVSYRPYAQESALVDLLLPQNGTNNLAAGQVQTYKVYGDSVHIGGPIVKFYDHLILADFKTVYKVGTLYGRYALDNEKEVNKPVNSSFVLNDGIDPFWQTLNDNVNAWPYNMFVDTTQISTPAVFGSQSEVHTYKLFITNNGFLWEQVD